MSPAQYAKNFAAEEARAITILADSIDQEFDKAVNIILNTSGKIIVSGVGKSGHIARKISATFASTGTNSFFIHPTEASHGDMGMIATNDAILALSKSGESNELKDIINYCKRFNIPLIAMTKNSKSTLGKAADCRLLLPQLDEAGPYQIAPTTSTTLSLVFGDALAMCCMKMRSFSPQQFKTFHPGGRLGQLLTSAREIMHTQNLPLLTQDETIFQAAIKMSEGLMGCVGIVDNNKHLIGIFTDGDLRRNVSLGNLHMTIGSLMTPNPHKASPDMFISEIANLFAQNKISSVFVCEQNSPIGIIHVQDLLKKQYI